MFETLRIRENTVLILQYYCSVLEKRLTVTFPERCFFYWRTLRDRRAGFLCPADASVMTNRAVT